MCQKYFLAAFGMKEFPTPKDSREKRELVQTCREERTCHVNGERKAIGN
jgi:hypothetical protein